jgi:hypothetical protein
MAGQDLAAEREALPGEVNGDALDRFTLAHAAAGVLMGLGRLPWWAALGLAIAWEVAENPLKDRFPGVFPHATHDRPCNAVADTCAVMAGWAAMRALPPLPGEKEP